MVALVTAATARSRCRVTTLLVRIVICRRRVIVTTLLIRFWVLIVTRGKTSVALAFILITA